MNISGNRKILITCLCLLINSIYNVKEKFEVGNPHSRFLLIAVKTLIHKAFCLSATDLSLIHHAGGSWTSFHNLTMQCARKETQWYPYHIRLARRGLWVRIWPWILVINVHRRWDVHLDLCVTTVLIPSFLVSFYIRWW